MIDIEKMFFFQIFRCTLFSASHRLMILFLAIFPASAFSQSTCEQFEVGIRTQIENNLSISRVCEIALDQGCTPAECSNSLPEVCGQDGAGCSEEAVARILKLNADVSRLETDAADIAKSVEEMREANAEAQRQNFELESKIAELEAGVTGGSAFSEALARIQTLEADLELAEQQRFLTRQAAAQATNALAEAEVALDVAREEEESLRKELSSFEVLRDWAVAEVHSSLERAVAQLSEGGCASPEVRQSIIGGLPVFTVTGQATTDTVASISELNVPEWADFTVEIVTTDRVGCAVAVGNFTFLEVAASPKGVTLDDFGALGLENTDLARASPSVCDDIGRLIETNPEFEVYRAASPRSMRGALMAEQVQGNWRVVSCVRGGGDREVYRLSRRPDAFVPYLVFLTGKK
ncbi:hypothetical protein [uncultured Tateyamaria sp.]|uniref:hypothetical protein n=1 Tax=uncultured Tateyamaria sp. TaxID=455651 RepID=UPI00261B00F3|nr:hypothetical protein [uncultured Tateyamaria sp.]